MSGHHVARAEGGLNDGELVGESRADGTACAKQPQRQRRTLRRPTSCEVFMAAGCELSGYKANRGREGDDVR